MSVKLECANVVLKDNEGNSGVVRTLSDADVVKVNGALADISDLQTRVKTVEDNGYVSYNGMQMLSETQREQAQANIDAPGLSVNNTFTGKITVESDVKADSFTLNTKSDYCQKCGFNGEIQIVEDDGKLVWECPKCGNRDQNTLNVARRTCGYIGTQFWNQGRTQEIKERVLHL